MKKFLLPGMLATMMFAACTNEDIVSQQTAEAPKADLSNRPVVGMVDLKFGPQTRLALLDGTFGTPKYVPGKDKIGARIIDNLTGSPCDGGHTVHKYEVKDVAWSNYRYDYTESGDWTSGALMVEGNYMFYTPYDAKALYRTPLEVVFPTEQKVSTLTPKAVPAKLDRNSYDSNTDAVDNFYKDGRYTVAVGHTFVDAKDESAGKWVTPEMTQLYAYPQITLVNKYEVPVMIEDEETGESVQAEDEEGNVVTEGRPITINEITIFSSNIKLNGTINQKNLVDALKLDIKPVEKLDGNGNVVKDDAGSTVYLCPGKTYQNWEDGQQTAWFSKNARTSTLVDFKETTITVNKQPVSLDGKITVALETPVVIPAGYMVTLNVVMPAATYAKNDLKVNVCVLTEDKEGNEVKMKFDEHAFVGDGVSEELSYAVAKRYAVEEYNFPANEADPTVKTSAGALATFELAGDLIPYEQVIKEPVDPTFVGIKDNGEFKQWLDGITDNSTAKNEGAEVDVDHQFKLHELHTVTLDADLMAAVYEYMNDKRATLSFCTKLYIQGSDNAEKPLVIDGAKFTGFGEVVLNGGYIKFLNTEIETVTFAENSNAVVSYEGTTISNVTKINGNLSDVTLTGTKVVFCGNLTLTNVTVNGEADFDGGCGQHTITLNNVTVNGTSHLSGAKNIVNNATLNGTVNVNGATDITMLTAEKLLLHNNGNVTVKGANAMTWSADMKGGNLVVNNKNWNPATITTSDKAATIDINVDWAPQSVVFSGAGARIVNVNAAVDFTNISWTPEYNDDKKLISSYTINNYKEITSDLTVPAEAVYNQAVENAAVTGDITNNGTINAWGVIEVTTNNGEIVAKTDTDEITVGAGTGTINNTNLAVVYDESDTQTIYYEGNDISAARIDAILAVTDARINKIISTAKWTVDSDWAIAKESALETIEFKGNNEMLYIGAATVDFAGLDIIINGNMSWRGRSLESSSIENLTATYKEGATLSTSKIDMTGAYAEVLRNGGTIVLTDDLKLTEPLTVSGNDVTVNLNGKTISANDMKVNVDGTDYEDWSFAFYVTSGTLTIDGDGNVNVVDNVTANAVLANGGNVVINGGSYSNTGEGSELIYARGTGTITINNGTFAAVKKSEGTASTLDLYLALNEKGGTADGRRKIIVNGGNFVNFNPANNFAEGEGTNFLAEGATVASYSSDGTTLISKAPKNAYTSSTEEKYGTVIYKVSK